MDANKFFAEGARQAALKKIEEVEAASSSGNEELAGQLLQEALQLGGAYFTLKDPTLRIETLPDGRIVGLSRKSEKEFILPEENRHPDCPLMGKNRHPHSSTDRERS